jgi:hypothetical protein
MRPVRIPPAENSTETLTAFMDKDRRIDELEAQVAELSVMVRRLRDDYSRANKGVPPAVASPPEPRPLEKKQAKSAGQPRNHGGESALIKDMRQRVDRYFGGDGEETFEALIGSVWLSRIAVIVLMTALVLSARTTFSSEAFGATQKVLIGYGIALVFIVYGLLVRRRHDLFSQAILGCGLAGFYFTTYAVFFVPEMQLQDAPAAGLPLLLGCMAGMAYIAHRRESQTVAGISLFLAYYTVVVSCTRDPELENMLYALLACTCLAAVTLVFHALHRWLLFSWAMLVVTHLTFLYFFFQKPPELDIPDRMYFWISNGFLTICFILFSFACILDARKTGEYRRMVAPLSGVNSAVFLAVTYITIRDQYPEHQWMFRIAVAGLMLVFAIFAETTGPRRNYLFQIFVAKAVIMFTLALQSWLAESGEILLVALAIECLALSFSYKRSGIVVFKVLGLLLMLITFTGCLFSLRIPGEVTVGSVTVPANWFSACGVAFVFQIVAWFYEKFVRRLRPADRITSGQWFLADTFLDLRSPTLAIMHTAAGALILLTITIFELSDHVMLPWVLALESLLLAVLGLLLRTPQIEIGSVLLLIAAHVCYHLFLWLPVPGFTEQEYYVLYTVLLAMLTFAGAHAWERYLKQYRHPDTEWEHQAVAALPWLAATFLLTTLAAQSLAPLHVPAAQAVIGMSIMLAGSLTGYPGVKASGLLGAGVASVTFYRALYNPAAPLAAEPGFLLFLALFLAALTGTERSLAVLEGYEKTPSRLEDMIRTLIIAVIMMLGLLGLYEWSPPAWFILYLLGFAVIAMALGAVFRESRYRWGALFLFAVVVLSAFRVINTLHSPYKELSFGMSAVVLLTVSWAYTRARGARRGSKAPDNRPAAEKAGSGNGGDAPSGHG